MSLFLRLLGNRKSSMVLLMFAGVVFSAMTCAQETIRVGGTGTGSLLLQQVSEVFSKHHAEINVKVMMPPMGSNGGLRALSADAIQVAIVTFTTYWPLTPESSANTNAIPWVRSPFIFTGRNMSETDVSIKQIAKIYSGVTTEWADGKPIRLITRPERESDTRILRAISPEMEEAVAQMLTQTSMPFAENDFGNQQLLESNQGSFGAMALGQILLTDSALKPIAIDGVLPTTENLQNGRYPYEKQLFLLTSKTPSAATREFIRYLQSKEALKVVRRYGFIPMHINALHPAR